MEKLNYLQLKCKEPGCPNTIRFTGEINVPGNFNFVCSSNVDNESLFINISVNSITTEPDRLFEKPLATSIKLFQDKADLNVNELFFEKRQNRPTQQVDKFYLTCDNGHTHPYQILTEI